MELRDIVDAYAVPGKEDELLQLILADREAAVREAGNLLIGKDEYDSGGHTEWPLIGESKKQIIRDEFRKQQREKLASLNQPTKERE